MNITDRRKLAMASSVRDFVATHPYANPGYTTAGERLTGRLTRADELVRQQIAGAPSQFHRRVKQADRLLKLIAGPGQADAIAHKNHGAFRPIECLKHLVHLRS